MFALPHKIKTIGTILLTASSLLLGFVWTYLEKVLPISSKQELSTIYLVQILSSSIIIVVALLSFIAVLLIFRVREEIKPQADEIPDKTKERNSKENLEDQFNRSILLQMLKLRGMNQVASPNKIAAEMKQDAIIVFAHLKKLHNEQYVTFITGGFPPTQESDFFLSPKAFDIINIKDGPSVNKFIYFNDLLWLQDDPVPFCLRCFEADNKKFHMFVKIEGKPPRYKCHHCGYYPKASKHPNDPNDPTTSKPKQPLSCDAVDG